MIECSGGFLIILICPSTMKMCAAPIAVVKSYSHGAGRTPSIAAIVVISARYAGLGPEALRENL